MSSVLQRVRNTINGSNNECLLVQPVSMMFAAKHAGMKFIDYTKDGINMAVAQLKLAEDFGIDCLLTCSDPAREVIDIAGEGSVDWLENQGPVINENRVALADKNRLHKFVVPDPFKPGRMYDRIKAIIFMREKAGKDMSIVGWVEGPLALGQELRGLNNIMTDFYDDTPFVKDLLDFASEVAIRYAFAQIESGADTIGMSDAAASLIGPDFYASFLWPVQLRVWRAIREKYPNVILRVHMCGNINSLLGKVKELPVDIYEIDFPTDLRKAREVLGKKRVISGNISTVGELLNGSPDEVYEACRQCHKICGKFYIVGAGCEISPNTPVENFRAMISYAKEHKPDQI